MSLFQIRPKVSMGSGHGSASEPSFEKDTPPTALLGVLLVLMVVVLFGVGFVVAELLRRVNDANTDGVNAQYQSQALVDQRALDKSRLEDYSKQESGAYTVPIERAKDLLLQRGSAAPLR